MKFSTKALVAAVALAASGVAFAQQDLQVVVYDATAGVELEGDANVVSGSTSQSYSSLTISGWSAFAAADSTLAADITAGKVDYVVLGGDGTSFADFSAPSGTTTSVTASALTKLIGVLPVIQTAETTQDTSTGNYYNLLTSGVSSTSWEGSILNGDYSKISKTLTVGTSTALYTESTANAPSAPTLLASPVVLSSAGVLTIGTASAVPEPGTYALMAAGLLAVGAIVRRRSQRA